MEKKQLELILTCALVVMLIILGGNALNRIRQRSASAPPAKTPSTTVQPAASTPAEEQKAIPQEKMEWVRDPFSGKYYGAAEVAGVDIKLHGIIWEGKNSMAMINNGILKLGDKIGGYTLIDIKQDSVTLSDGNKTLELKLHR